MPKFYAFEIYTGSRQVREVFATAALRDAGLAAVRQSLGSEAKGYAVGTLDGLNADEAGARVAGNEWQPTRRQL